MQLFATNLQLITTNFAPDCIYLQLNRCFRRKDNYKKKWKLKKNELYSGFEVVEAPDNGQIILKIERALLAKERGILLLELEEKLKSALDKGISVWLEPVGDKSKLRNLRGIKFN